MQPCGFLLAGEKRKKESLKRKEGRFTGGIPQTSTSACWLALASTREARTPDQKPLPFHFLDALPFSFGKKKGQKRKQRPCYAAAAGEAGYETPPGLHVTNLSRRPS
jgi:hypothetical protein